MTDPSATVEQPHEILPPVDRGMSIGKATVIAVISGIIVLGSTIAVIKGTLSAGLKRLFCPLWRAAPHPPHPMALGDFARRRPPSRLKGEGFGVPSPPLPTPPPRSPPGGPQTKRKLGDPRLGDGETPPPRRRHLARRRCDSWDDL